MRHWYRTMIDLIAKSEVVSVIDSIGVIAEDMEE